MTEKQYFPHEIGARNNPKLQALEIEMGKAGKGLWWDIVDYMYECDGVLPADYRLLAYVLRAGADEIRRVVEDFGLFIIEDGTITKTGVTERIERKNAASEQRREAGRLGGRPRKADVKAEVFNTETTEKAEVFNEKSPAFANQIKTKEIKENQSSAGAGAPTREEDDFLIEQFFFKNFKNPGREVGRCLENYKGQEVKDWGKVAAAWQPANTAPRFDDPRALQWARELFGIILQGNDRQTACECLRHIDDIAIDKNRNELKVRMRGDAWLQAVKGLLTAHPELLEGYEAVNTCKCVGS